MNRNKKRRQKRMEQKRNKRNRKKLPQIQWLTDTLFVMYFDDENIDNLYSSVTVEIVDDDYEFPAESDLDTDIIDLN